MSNVDSCSRDISDVDKMSADLLVPLCPPTRRYCLIRHITSVLHDERVGGSVAAKMFVVFWPACR